MAETWNPSGGGIVREAEASPRPLLRFWIVWLLVAGWVLFWRRRKDAKTRKGATV